MEKKVDILMLDYSISGFSRYAVKLCEEIHKLRPETIVAGCYIEQSKGDTIKGFDIVICAKDKNLDAKKIIDLFQPKAIMTFAHRFFDYMFTVEAHKRNIQVLNFQHGLYTRETVISTLTPKSLGQTLRKKQKKFFEYLQCSFILNDKSIMKTFEFLSNFLQNKSIYTVMNQFFGEICNADISYIYGEDWKSFYINEYYEKNTTFEIVGYPELETELENVNRTAFIDSSLPVVCYLAQTSVEDGLIEKETLRKFLEKLSECLTNINLLIKFHPRSDKHLYRTLFRTGKVLVWEEKAFPVADMYIGHDSTIIAKALYLNSKTLIYRLQVDRISQFEPYVHYIACENDDLNQILKRMYMEPAEDISRKLKKYVYKNEHEGALKQTAKSMIKYCSN